MKFVCHHSVTNEMLELGEIPWESLRRKTVESMFNSIGKELQKLVPVEEIPKGDGTDLNVELYAYNTQTMDSLLNRIRKLGEEHPALKEELKQIYQTLKFK